MAETYKGVVRRRLTKKFLFELPTKSYLVSNVMHSKDKPIYENRIVAISKREKQWGAIKQLSANNRLCYVFRNKSHYKEWKSQFIKGYSNRLSDLFEDSAVSTDKKFLSKYQVKLNRLHIEIAKNSNEKHVIDNCDHLYQDAKAALVMGDLQSLEDIIISMENLHQMLKIEYTIRIVSRPNIHSGIWRYSKYNPSIKKYYIIVEAITPDGKRMALPIRDEENGETSTTQMWGVRVSGRVFNQIWCDKRDNGKIDNSKFGLKRLGYLTPKYLYPIKGGMITKW